MYLTLTPRVLSLEGLWPDRPCLSFSELSQGLTLKVARLPRATKSNIWASWVDFWLPERASGFWVDVNIKAIYSNVFRNGRTTFCSSKPHKIEVFAIDQRAVFSSLGKAS